MPDSTQPAPGLRCVKLIRGGKDGDLPDRTARVTSADWDALLAEVRGLGDKGRALPPEQRVAVIAVFGRVGGEPLGVFRDIPAADLNGLLAMIDKADR